MSKNNKTKNSTLKLVAASVSLAALAYGSYKYLTESSTPESPPTFGIQNDAVVTDSNPLRRKQERNTRITLVITNSVLEWIKTYNESHEDGIDLQNYLEIYPNLVIILYPEITLSDIELYFEINGSFKHRILLTEKEESVFHLMKHLNNNINLLNVSDFSINNEEIDRIYRLSQSLHNLILLNTENSFIQYM